MDAGNKEEMKMKFLRALGIRVLKTMAETALSLIGTNYVGVTEVDWVGVGSACLLSGVITVLFCIKGLPEVK